jgi:anti-sigma factor RsiW
MKRLELIMSDIDRDAAANLLSDHIENTLSSSVRSQVDGWLAKDEGLRVERARLVSLLSLLHAQPEPTDTPDMVATVRRRLANDRAPAAPSQPARSSSAWGWRAQGLMAGLAVAAGVGGIVALSEPRTQPTQAVVQTAGVGADVQASTTLVVPGADLPLVAQQARRQGCVVFEAAGQTIVRGRLEMVTALIATLKADAAVRGVDVVGLLPQADPVEVVIRDRP